ncbi:hypothetical protein HYDPIDRAFT_116299 [Hydnomerulius pinastri MD-312]|uniref:Uncharacterized protein n=1 Tax=Hydnomerulius pinastri MD-312 TaxID=994086 RepID=A0A0C9WBS1_9AGAM|nr:hypothetical protein HYDPIDRAFT_117413 [Hydnomerulius pinastri MD-312]KIJ61062.1 hypothetical protein HYDPIDRAFT_116299 [Hydnomerulius pinastri MD-312]
MSDSHPQSTVSNDAFEALIDLLASDGIDGSPRTNNITLRDSSGKLDFEKIRSMYGGHDRGGTSDRSGPEALGLEGSDDERDADDTVQPTVYSLTALSRSNSHSPGLTTHPLDNPPSHILEARLNSMLGAPSPLSFDEINTALSNAHAEVRSLRQQYDELHALVDNARRGHRPLSRGSSTSVVGAAVSDRPADGARLSDNAECFDGTRSGNPLRTKDSGVQPLLPALPSSPPPPLPSETNIPPEIACLSEGDVKRVLTTLTHALNLSPSTLSSLPPLPTPTPTQPQHDIATLTRTIHFLASVDELVWRRTSSNAGMQRDMHPVYSAENTAAIFARLELWERVVRGR